MCWLRLEHCVVHTSGPYGWQVFVATVVHQSAVSLHHNQHSAGQLVRCKPLLRCATAVSLLLLFVCEVPVARQQAPCGQTKRQQHAAQPCSLNQAGRCRPKDATCEIHILPLHKQPPIECTGCPQAHQWLHGCRLTAHMVQRSAAHTDTSSPCVSCCLACTTITRAHVLHMHSSKQHPALCGCCTAQVVHSLPTIGS